MLSDELRSLHGALRAFRNEQDELHLNDSQLASLLNAVSSLIETAAHLERTTASVPIPVVYDPVVIDLNAFRARSKPDPPKGGAA